MKKRVDALNRMVRVQTKMRDLGQWRVSALERERADLRDDLRSLFGALETCDLAHGWQAALTARRARALMKRIDDLEGESERVRRKAETDGRRARLAEDAAETAAKVYREHTERKALAELIERALMRRDASQG